MSAFAGLTVERCRARIRARNDELHAVLREIDPPQRDPSAPADAPLAGVPYVLKDTWDTAGIVTTGGSWRHRHRIPSASCHAHRALSAAGALLLGKSNLCDLAFSVESDNHLRGPVCNPYDLTRTAGGSTGGGAAAVADGMAAFDWGTDFGGSIRGPAAFCGLVGLRLSHRAWPVGYEHFPRIAPFFHDLCGMGPLTKTVEGARTVTRAVRSALRRFGDDVTMEPDRVVLYVPDRAHDDEWPTFLEDTARLLRSAGVAYEIARELPTPTEVNELFNEYLASHFAEFIASDELPLREGLPAVLVSLLTGGRVDKRVHPNTAVLLAGTAALSLRYRDKRRSEGALEKLRADLDAIWSQRTLVVSPTTTMRAPRHGQSAFQVRLMTFCKLGNLVDATALALPFGHFPEKTARSGLARSLSTWPAMPRSLQILGPAGSEEAVLALAARLEAKLHT
ncbi:MAG: amidase [Deltaproteobacteria bacterium]|nr:amidase [Deltaproteobacteria bacterium]